MINTVLHKVLTYIEYRAVSGVFRTIDPPTPLNPASVSSPRTEGRGTVKKFDEVVRHLHLVTQDQFRLVSEKVFGIPEENFTINIELFWQAFKNVVLLRQSWKVSKAALQGREPLSFRFTIWHSTAAPHFPISIFKVLNNKYEKRRYSCLRHRPPGWKCKSKPKGGLKPWRNFFYKFHNLFLPTTSTLKRLRIKK